MIAMATIQNMKPNFSIQVLFVEDEPDAKASVKYYDVFALSEDEAIVESADRFRSEHPEYQMLEVKAFNLN